MLSGLMPPNVSTFGGQIDSVLYLILYIVGFWFLLTEGLLIYFAVSSRRKKTRGAAYLRGDTPRQMAWVLVPAVVVLCLDLGIDSAGNSAWELAKNSHPPSTIEVKVTAKQFNWEFTYPGPDGKLGTADDVSIENELHVPVGKVVHLTLTSEDVIHSLWVPNFRLKQDVVPGRAIPAWFEATKAGTYEIACSELCGFGHYSMHGAVTVHSQQDYDNWLRDNITHHGATASAGQ
jgi:cytochrome c oxidase subunit II